VVVIRCKWETNWALLREMIDVFVELNVMEDGGCQVRCTVFS
jgi:hypothetical protein